MPNFAGITPAPKTDGIPYAVASVVPAVEGDLFNASPPPVPGETPVSCGFEQGVMAIGTLTVTGNPAGNTTYVVLQTDLGDNNWIDVAWFLWTGTSGSITFVLQGGNNGSNAFFQTRAAGTAPAATGFVKSGLGGRIRFIGKATLSSSSSSSSSSSPGPGASAQVTCSLRYRLYDFGGST